MGLTFSNIFKEVDSNGLGNVFIIKFIHETMTCFQYCNSMKYKELWHVLSGMKWGGLIRTKW